MKRDSIHTIIALSFPFFFVISISHIFNTFFDIPINPILITLLFLLTGTEAVFSARIRSKKESDAPSSIFRECIIVFPLLLFLLYLSGGTLFFRDKSIPFESYVFYTILISVQWPLSFRFQKKLIDREKLFNPANKGKKDLLNMYFSTAHKNLKDLKKQHFFTLGAFLLIYLFISLWIKNIPFSVSLLFFLFLSIWIFFLVLLNRYAAEEQWILSGVKPEPMNTLSVFFTVLLLAVIAVTAFLFASKVTILSINPVITGIRKFFLFIGSLIHEKEIKNIPVEEPQPEANNFTVENYQSLPDETNPIWTAILHVTGIIFLFLPIMVILFLLLLPLFKSFKQGKKSIHRGISSFYLSLIAFFKDLFSPAGKKDKKGEKRLTLSDFYSLKPEEPIRKRKKSTKKKEPVDPVVKGYNDIIIWGERMGIPVNTSLGPEEHLLRCAERIPEKGVFFTESAVFIEKYLYSGQLAQKNEIKNFLRNIKKETKDFPKPQERKS